MNDENSIENPDRVAPRTQTATVTVPDSSHTFPAISLTVLRVRAKH
jgi:alpha-L-arabinofuranosidase